MKEKPAIQKSKKPKEDIPCDKYRPEREYTDFQTFIDNLPYMFMILIGAAVLLAGFGLSLLGFVMAGGFILYGIVGALWIIIFVCPYCEYYDSRGCPCGYGKIAVKFREKSSENRFAEKFKKHIPVIVPLWIVPLAFGVLFLVRNFNMTLLWLVIAFAVNSYIVLPLIARIYGCGHCPQKHDCPWM